VRIFLSSVLCGFAGLLTFPALSDAAASEHHGPSRIMLGTVHGDEGWQGDLQWRYGVHGLLDPVNASDKAGQPQGYPSGSQFELASLDVRFDRDEIRLQKAALLSLVQLSDAGGSDSSAPLVTNAWKLEAQLRRFAGADAELFSEVVVGAGHSILTGFGKRGSPSDDREFASIGDAFAYGLVELISRADNQFDDGYQLSAGVRAGWLWQGRMNQERIEFSWQPSLAGDDTFRRELTIEEALNGFGDVQLRFGFRREWADSAAVNTWNVNYVWYY